MPQPVVHRAEPFQSGLDALVIAVTDVVMHAGFERLNAVIRRKMVVLLIRQLSSERTFKLRTQVRQFKPPNLSAL